MRKRIMTCVFMILTIMMIWQRDINVAANVNREKAYNSFLEKNGQWIVEDAWNGEDSTVDYYIEFYPNDRINDGTLIFGYQTSSGDEIDYWYGSYWLKGAVDNNFQRDERWEYQYSLEAPEGERSGTFILEIDGENLILTENTGDCFWAFSSDSSETMVFEEIQILDGDGYVYEDTIEDDEYYINNNLDVHKQILLDTDSMCGAIYLGYVDSSYGSLTENRTYLEELLFTSGYIDDFPFLMDIPDDHIAEVDGGMELYCIYPFDERASVSVIKYEVDENTNLLIPAEVIYSSDYGDPILVRCNATEVFWDAEVNIVDSNNYKLSWMPRMSMMDGKMEVPEEAPFVYDATRYVENDAAYDEGYGDGYVQPASTLPVLMTYEEIQSEGHEVLNYKNGEVSVYATKTYSDAEGEILRIGGFCGEEPLWGYVSNYPYLTELDNTTAFIAGTAQDPQVAIFNVEAGLMMVDMFFGDMLWEKSAEYLQVGGTPCFHVTEDGNIYCSGYYDDGPTAIAADGHIIWRAQKSHPDIYWAYGIEAETDVVLVQYATGTDVGNDVVAFDINDGTELWYDIQPYY